jgi:hypothetical protein
MGGGQPNWITYDNQCVGVKRKKKRPSPYAFGSSQDTHFVLVTSLSTIQTLQVHVPGAFVGSLSPEAAQLKPPDGITGLGGSAAAVSAGAMPSQEAHSAVAASLRPAAAQSEPGLKSSGTAAGTVVVPFFAEFGRGSSQETHLDSLAPLVTIQVPHVHEPVAFTGGLTPAASQSKPTEAGFAPTANANVGRDDGSTAEAAVRSLACLKGDG